MQWLSYPIGLVKTNACKLFIEASLSYLVMRTSYKSYLIYCMETHIIWSIILLVSNDRVEQNYACRNSLRYLKLNRSFLYSLCTLYLCTLFGIILVILLYFYPYDGHIRCYNLLRHLHKNQQ